MLSHQEGWKRSFQPGVWLFTLVCLLVLAATPAGAQIEPMKNWTLVTGHWSRGAHDTVAWLDLATWNLATKIDGFSPAAGDPQPQPWKVVVGDWDGSGVQSVKMFDPHTWKLVAAADGPQIGSSDPQPTPWVPVAGDWDGRGIETVRVVDLRDRSVHRIEEGPIRFDRYEPEPEPWIPVAGNWDGHGTATIAWLHTAGATSAWKAVAGDWDGSGIDTVAAVHSTTGELVTAAATSLRTPSGCYMVIKNSTDIEKVFYGYDGSVTVIHIKMHEEWTCCPLDRGYHQYSCTEKLVFG